MTPITKGRHWHLGHAPITCQTVVYKTIKLSVVITLPIAYMIHRPYSWYIVESNTARKKIGWNRSGNDSIPTHMWETSHRLPRNEIHKKTINLW